MFDRSAENSAFLLLAPTNRSNSSGTNCSIVGTPTQFDFEETSCSDLYARLCHTVDGRNPA